MHLPPRAPGSPLSPSEGERARERGPFARLGSWSQWGPKSARTLSPDAQAAAERHLSECPACRQMVERERQFALSLTDSFHRATASLRLPPEVQRRVLMTLAEERRAPEAGQASFFSWVRLAWPQALAASVLLLLAGLFFFTRAPVPKPASAPPRRAADEVLVQLSYIVPTYTFRHEDGFVVDALIYQTNVVSERFPAELARLH